jgi:transcriptional regulator with XRE-family HTH domain
MRLDFQRLHLRLVTHLRDRVESGLSTERSLARMTGVSQPHLHNVLKGKRSLSIEMADRILDRLDLDLKDLMTAEEGSGPA